MYIFVLRVKLIILCFFSISELLVGSLSIHTVIAAFAVKNLYIFIIIRQAADFNKFILAFILLGTKQWTLTEFSVIIISARNLLKTR